MIMNKSFVKKFVSKVFEEMKETDKQINKKQKEVEKRVAARKTVIKEGIRIKKKHFYIIFCKMMPNEFLLFCPKLLVSSNLS